jgi:hypothetical protein
MSWALGEIKALSIKAAKGAGFDWGIAEEAGFAVEWLEARGLPGTRAMAQYLSRYHRETGLDIDFCPLRKGCFVSDTNDLSSIEKTSAFQPVLMAPFIANVIEGETVKLSWDKNKLVISKDGVDYNTRYQLINEPCKLFENVELSSWYAPRRFLPHKTRIGESEKAYISILNALAHKTYAPATEESRLAGAGAGLNDND